MIGRDGPVRPFELIRWAREQAGALELAQLEAHLLLVLATYANRDAACWPSLRTLARDCRRGRSQISAALRRLEELDLVWSVQGGRGRAARRELLFNPNPTNGGEPCAADGAAETVRPAGLQDVARKRSAVRPAGLTAVRPAGLHVVNGHRNGQDEGSDVPEASQNGHVMQSGQPDCNEHTPDRARSRRPAPRPISAILEDLQGRAGA